MHRPSHAHAQPSIAAGVQRCSSPALQVAYKEVVDLSKDGTLPEDRLADCHFGLVQSSPTSWATNQAFLEEFEGCRHSRQCRISEQPIAPTVTVRELLSLHARFAREVHGSSLAKAYMHQLLSPVSWTALREFGQHCAG